MQNQNRIALLIDADNTSYSALDAFMKETGYRLAVKRAYGNWSKDYLKNWEGVLRRHGIRAVQQFDCAVGKNAADIALAVDAMELLHTGLCDSFIIMASDSDYAPLVMKLRESGVHVAGVGKETAPEAYKNACDDFYLLESFFKAEESETSGLIDDLNLENDTLTDILGESLTDLDLEMPDSPVPIVANGIWDGRLKEEGAEERSSGSIWDLPDDFEDVLEDAPSKEEIVWDHLFDDIDAEEITWETFETLDSVPPSSLDAAKMQSVHKLLHVAYDYCKGEDGFALLSGIGNFIHEIRPDFDYRDYGFKQLHELLLAYPDQYEVISYPPRARTRVMAFRCCA